MLRRLRRRQDAHRPAQANAEALVRDHGAEAHRRERDVILPDGTTHAGRTPTHWRRVALIVAHDRQESRRQHGDPDAQMTGASCSALAPASAMLAALRAGCAVGRG